MKKKKISLRDCTEKDILAEDVLNSQGFPLVVKNTNINSFIKNKLSKLYIDIVTIYDSESIVPHEEMDNRVYEEYQTNIEDIKELLNELSSGKGLEHSKIERISENIYSWKEQQNDVIEMLTKIRNADLYTYTHCINTAFYSMLISQWLFLSEEDCKKAIQAGLLHDMGKIRINNEVLNKKDPLTFEEFEEIKNHSWYGYNILRNIEDLDFDVLEAILDHHERIDGSGYPRGKKGGQLNLFTKIVSIADVYDAMISDRIYKKRTSPFEVFKLFLTSGVGAFDPTILDVFINNIAGYYTGFNVSLSNAKIGEIVFIPPYDVGNPIIHVDSQYIDLSREKDMRVLCII